jgi:ABC-type antimicrobial peptide transport system permease subunit
VETVTVSGEQARELRWAGGLMLGAGLVLTRLPAGAGLPCPLRSITGVPCPLCGMTTSVKSALAGHLGDAVAANPAGVVAVILAVVLLAARPESIRLPPLAVIVAVLAAMWAFELARFGLLPGFG